MTVDKNDSLNHNKLYKLYLIQWSRITRLNVLYFIVYYLKKM